MTQSTDEHTLKKGTAELLVLAQLEDEPRHGYDIAMRIEQRSKGDVVFNVASLYPILYRLEAQGAIAGRWVERAGERRRRFYKLTASGRKKLIEQRKVWSGFMLAVQRAAGIALLLACVDPSGAGPWRSPSQFQWETTCHTGPPPASPEVKHA